LERKPERHPGEVSHGIAFAVLGLLVTVSLPERRSSSMVARSAAVSPEWIAQTERRLAALEKQLATGQDRDRWERRTLYAKARGISDRTVDRRIEARLLEKWKPDGSNTVYVREIAHPPSPQPQSAPTPKRRRRRRLPIAGDDGLPMSAAPGAPLWPFNK
jgi:hypothetical protein